MRFIQSNIASSIHYRLVILVLRDDRSNRIPRVRCRGTRRHCRTRSAVSDGSRRSVTHKRRASVAQGSQSTFARRGSRRQQSLLAAPITNWDHRRFNSSRSKISWRCFSKVRRLLSKVRSVSSAALVGRPLFRARSTTLSWREMRSLSSETCRSAWANWSRSVILSCPSSAFARAAVNHLVNAAVSSGPSAMKSAWNGHGPQHEPRDGGVGLEGDVKSASLDRGSGSVAPASTSRYTPKSPHFDVGCYRSSGMTKIGPEAPSTRPSQRRPIQVTFDPFSAAFDIATAGMSAKGTQRQ